MTLNSPLALSDKLSLYPLGSPTSLSSVYFFFHIYILIYQHITKGLYFFNLIEFNVLFCFVFLPLRV